MTKVKVKTQVGTFIYKSYSFKMKSGDLVINFHFVQRGIKDKDINFKPHVIIKNVDPKTLKNNKDVIDNLVFNLGLIEMLSYFKAVLSPEIIIEAGYLDKKQIKWWQSFLISGAMSEFFYINKIDFTKKDFVKIKNSTSSPRTTLGVKTLINKSEKILLQMSGGKDSLTSYEILKNAKKDLICFTLNPTKETIGTLKIAKCNNVIIAKRNIDKNLLKLNKEGYLNGHTPFSVYLAFLSDLLAVLFDCKYIVASNALSANYGSTKYKGQVVNHQFAKSIFAENLFREYEKKHLKTNVDYFSFLRPINDIAVIKLFAKYGEKYFDDFTSCNNVNKKWCNKCAKCVSTFVVLSLFLNEKELKNIFGKNLLKDKNLKPLIKELKQEDRRPLDCVATHEEILAVLNKDKKTIDKLLNHWEEDNNLPQEFEQILKNSLLTTKERITEHLKDKKILILGFGKEGNSTLKFLRTILPKIKIGIADRDKNINVKDKNTTLHTGKNYLKAIRNYDLVFKSPGIVFSSKNKITSQTKFFLNYCPGTVIGITGTEGKSTTSFLIYNILKEAGLAAYLIGNIGNPVLDYLLQAKKCDIFIYEMSSYQLQDIQKSPNISVFLNIFNDHLDYHKNFTNYLKAKQNITRYQNKDDYFIYNGKQKELKKIVSKSKAIKIDYNKEKVINLPSNKNLYIENIKAGIAVANIFNIKANVIKKVLKNFKSLEHRLEYVGKYNDIIFYNDSASKVPEATVYALRTLGIKVATLILGGANRKKTNFRELIRNIEISNIKNLILLDTVGKKIGEKITNKNINKFYASDMKEVVKLAYKYTNKNKICLLSPAAVSYGMFKNFDDRGNQFKKFVTRS